MSRTDAVNLSATPAKHLLVITCMDTRIDPLEVAGVKLGDAHIARNAFGIVTDDMLRSAAASQAIGTTEIMVIQHSGCGGLKYSDEDIRQTLMGQGAARAPIEFSTFDNVEQSVLASVERLRACTWLPHRDRISGYVLDIETGQLTRVDVVETGLGL